MIQLKRRKYISRISFEDFAKLYPEEAPKLTGGFPHCVAVSWCEYPTPSANGWNKVIHISDVKHIYSTRDYWEVHAGDNRVCKVSKRLTGAIYQVEVK